MGVAMPCPRVPRWRALQATPRRRVPRPGRRRAPGEMREMQRVKPELVAQLRFVAWTAEGACVTEHFSASAVIKAPATSGEKTPSVRLFLAF
jgi:hypothetical protein